MRIERRLVNKEGRQSFLHKAVGKSVVVTQLRSGGQQHPGLVVANGLKSLDLGWLCSPSNEMERSLLGSSSSFLSSFFLASNELLYVVGLAD